MADIYKKSFEFFPLMMKHSMRPIIYTGIPLIFPQGMLIAGISAKLARTVRAS